MMKLTIFIVCCLISTMHYSVEGGLVKDFFGKIKETADVVHKDVKEIWRPDSTTTNKETEHGDDTVTTPVAPNAAKDNTPEKKEDSKVSEIMPDVNQNNSDGSTSSTTEATEVKEKEHEETTTVSYSTTTKKEDRAALSGGCQAGFKRTDNGRCMATF